MRPSVIFGVLLGIFSSQAHAVLMVDGQGSGGSYASLQDAVNAYLASPTETTIQIATNALTGGVNMPEGTVLPRPLTIEAAPGFKPVIDGRLRFLPDNS